MATFGGGDWWYGNTYTTSATSSSWPYPASAYGLPLQSPAPAPAPARKLSDREWLDERLAAVIGS